ncbi:MAG TPA: carboxypeptidase M32 [Gemmatales bacterium]|nr:carboxypeptidase M32 [Gemmatales bacterium]
MSGAYAELCRRERERMVLASCAGLLAWDERTYLPPRGVAHRGEQLALLARLCHERISAPALAELVAQAADEVPADSPEAANVREIRRHHERAVRVPARLVEELARATSQGQQAWEEAKRTDDFALFRPHLARLMELKREEAMAIGAPSGEWYDALLDEYEPGLTANHVAQVFGELRTALAPLVEAVRAAPRQAPVELLQRRFPIDRQKLLVEMVAAAIGFDFTAGRLDVTVHPFCSGHGPGDVRLTTRYNEQHLNEALFGTLHEAGHGIYEQNLPVEHAGLPLGTACSLGVHESQSRLWENFIGRSRPFWSWLFPFVQGLFPQALAGVILDDFHFAVNDVRPSFIRIEADEVTYNLHIILRFELERDLIRGDLAPADLPAAWNEKFAKTLGLRPTSDAVGCLQDVHWSAGLVGYFPTYTLGNLLAAQLMEQARHDLSDLSADCERGHFAPLKDWLVDRVHRHGQRWRPTELCRQATGHDLVARPLLDHLGGKLRELYDVE